MHMNPKGMLCFKRNRRFSLRTAKKAASHIYFISIDTNPFAHRNLKKKRKNKRNYLKRNYQKTVAKSKLDFHVTPKYPKTRLAK